MHLISILVHTFINNDGSSFILEYHVSTKHNQQMMGITGDHYSSLCEPCKKKLELRFNPLTATAAIWWHGIITNS